MPELPEVEVLRRHLEPRLVGRTVRRAQVFSARHARPASAGDVERAVTGARFEAVRRRGKFLLFELRRRDGVARPLVAHLGMTGRMWVDDGGAAVPRHGVAVLGLDIGRFVFEDARKFGRFGFGEDGDVGLGPEPLDPSWTGAHLVSALGRSAQPVKTRLMDQSVVAGIGNIYASEILFEARVHPLTPSRAITAAAVARIHAAAVAVLARAIRRGESLALDFSGGSDGLFYFGSAGGGGDAVVGEAFQVYDRAGQPCRCCGGPILRRVVAGRTTYWCGGCQSRGAGRE